MTTRETYRDDDIQIFHTEGIVFKIIVVGDAEVGKTSLVRSHTKAKFDSSYHTTVGVNIAKETLTVPQALIKEPKASNRISLLIWDIAGQGQFYLLHKAYFNGATGIIYAFDLTRPATLTNIKQNWWKSCNEYGVGNVPSVLVGNKSDLPPMIIRPAALNMAKTLGDIPYFETSAKNGDMVDAMFMKLVELMLEYWQ